MTKTSDLYAEAGDAVAELYALGPTGTSELIAADGDGPARFDVTAYTGGLLNVPLYEVPAVIDLEGFEPSPVNAPSLLDHVRSQRVGHCDSARVEDGEVRHAITASASTEYRREVVESARDEYPWQVSIGVRVLEATRVSAGETKTINGREFAGPIVHVARSRHIETSFVSIGGDAGGATAKLAAEAADQAKTNNSKTPEKHSVEYEEFVASCGFEADSLTAEQDTYLKAQFELKKVVSAGPTPGRPVTSETPTGEELTAQLREAAAAETERVADVVALCAEFGGEAEKPLTVAVDGKDVPLQAHAVREGWTVEETELYALRNSRRQAPAVHTGGRETGVEVVEAALMARSGVDIGGDLAAMSDAPRWARQDVNSEGRQRVMEAADRMGGLSMIDYCRHAVRADGRADPVGQGDLLRAAFSGGSLNRIFTTSVNARVMIGFAEAPDTTAGWTRGVDVNDFRKNEANRLTKGGGGLKKLPRGGEVEDREVNDTGEEFQIARYSEGFSIDEQDVIDDRFDLLTQMPEEMAADAARLRPDLVYSLLLANPDMADGNPVFQAGEGNLLTSPLTEEGLQAAITALKKQSEGGVSLDLRPTDLIVPTELEFAATRILNSVEIRSAEGEGTANVVRGMVRNITVEGRLSNGVTNPDTGVFAAGSDNGWFLADRRTPAVYLAYRAGTGRRPQVRSHTYQKDRYGIRHEVSYDIGAKIVRRKSHLFSQPS